MTRDDGNSQLLFPNGYFPIEGGVEIAVDADQIIIQNTQVLIKHLV